MSVKHINEYYDQIKKQYLEMLDNLTELEDDLSKNIVEPEYVERLRNMVKPIKDNYMQISWIMYLLHKPNRKTKEKAYETRMKAFMKSLDKNKTTDKTINQNNSIIDDIKNRKIK